MIILLGISQAQFTVLAVDVTWTNAGGGDDWGKNGTGASAGPQNWDDGIAPGSLGTPTFWYYNVSDSAINPNPGKYGAGGTYPYPYFFNPNDAAVFVLGTGNALKDVDVHDDIVIGLVHFSGTAVDNKTFYENFQDDLIILTGGASTSLGQSTAGIGLLNRSDSVFAFEQYIEIDPTNSGPTVVNNGTTQIWRVSGTGADPVGFVIGRSGSNQFSGVWADDDAGGAFNFVGSQQTGTGVVSGTFSSATERQQRGNESQGGSSTIQLTLDTIRDTDFITFHGRILNNNQQTQDYYNASNGGAGQTNDFISIVKTGSGAVNFSNVDSGPATPNTGIRDTQVNEGQLILNWQVDTAASGGYATGTTDGRTLTVGDGTGGVDADLVMTLRNQQINDTHNIVINSSGALLLGGSSVVIQSASSTSRGLTDAADSGTTTRTSSTITANNITEVVGVVTMDGGRIGGNPGSHLVLEGGTVFASDASGNRQTALINTSTVSLNEGNTAGAVTFNITNDGFAATDLEINSAIIGAETASTVASTVTQTGNGVLMYSGTGQNNYSGLTTVSGTGSVLALNKTASGSNYALSGDLQVNSGATVRWDQSNQVNGPPASDGGSDDTDVTLNGGTLLFTNSTSEGGTGATETAMSDARGMGSLTLTGANTISFIDFSAGGGSQIVHFDTSPSGWTATSLLHVLNWDGIPWTGHLQAAFQLGVEGGNGTNQLIFGNSEDGLGTSDDTFSQRTGLTGSSQVDQIRFINPTVFGVTYSGTFGAIILNTGEVVPYAIPERGTVGVALAVLAFAGIRFWRRRCAHVGAA